MSSRDAYQWMDDVRVNIKFQFFLTFSTYQNVFVFWEKLHLLMDIVNPFRIQFEEISQCATPLTIPFTHHRLIKINSFCDSSLIKFTYKKFYNFYHRVDVLFCRSIAINLVLDVKLVNFYSSLQQFQTPVAVLK